MKFKIDDNDPDDQYAQLYAPGVVNTINNLKLPRYGLGNYTADNPQQPPTTAEGKQLDALSRAGKRLMGFSRTNLFKRLESSAQAFLLSIERHILRNCIFLHAIDKNLSLPIGTQDGQMLDARFYDEDAEAVNVVINPFEDDSNTRKKTVNELSSLYSELDFQRRAEEVYQLYTTQYKRRFRWIRPNLFTRSLREDLAYDAHALLAILKMCGAWNADKDAKLNALAELLTRTHQNEKIIIFTQFADTAHYLETELQSYSIPQLAAVTGASEDPTGLAWHFSTKSNGKQKTIKPKDEIRVMLATDVLSEGQNLQDAAIVVNYDLPWAIIRLVQRVGRVDRIGQEAENILCYSFLPAEGVEQIIRLRERVRQRLHENAEVVGTDESFFEDDRDNQAIVDLYHEKAGILDDELDTEVDLASYAYQIWKNAITKIPQLQRIIPDLPPVVYSTKTHTPSTSTPEGTLVYLRTPEGNDALAWLDKYGNSVTESQFTILQAAACQPNTTALQPLENHHLLVEKGVELILSEEKSVGGQLGRPSGARFKTYERLKNYVTENEGTLFVTPELRHAVDEIYRYPLRQAATDTLNRQLRLGISNETLVQLVIELRNDDRLCIIHEEGQEREAQIICSMGLKGEV